MEIIRILCESPIFAPRMLPNTLTYFPDGLVKGIELPERFTYPFCYEPHPLTLIAVTALQHYLETQADLDHNFGLTQGREGAATGKMFGVLVVRDGAGDLGYLSAFSGKLAGSNHHPGFVPPVFDMLEENGFFVKGIQTINTINQQIRKLVADDGYTNLKQDLERSAALSVQETDGLKKKLKINKVARKKLRAELQGEDDGGIAEAELVRRSLYDKHLLTVLVAKWDQALKEKRAVMESYEASIDALKNKRKERSAALQQQLFEHYEFMNRYGDRKSLQAIFNDTATGTPPSAAGECATPKLLQYAFLNGYEPLAMAEFWWGASPASGVMKHKQFYPACTDRCKPILEHMLKGMAIEQEPTIKDEQSKL